MGFFNILNMKWKIIIMLIIVQKKFYFQYIKKNSWLHVIFFDKEQWAIYFTLLTPWYQDISCVMEQVLLQF
jgi:hypothetical protein